MMHTVSANTFAKISLNEADPVKSILQNVSIILRTFKGSCPMYRDFGIQTSLTDRPIPVVKALLYNAIREAIEKYEPRVEVAGIDFADGAEMSGVLEPIVEVNIVNE